MATLNKDYSIIKINEKRLKTQLKIEQDLSKFTRHYFDCVDGHDQNSVKQFFINNSNIKDIRPTRAGYLGHWISFLNGLNYIIKNDLESLIILEDDAILSKTFIQDLEVYMSNMPEDYDFFMLYESLPNANNYMFSKKDVRLRVPQRVKITEDMKTINSDWDIGSKHIVRTYQRFGSVGQIFSNSGAKKIIELTEKNGFGKSRWQSKPFDMTMYEYSFDGLLNGYQPNPNCELNSLVTIEETIPGTDNETQIQGTKYIHIDKILEKNLDTI